MSDNSTLKDPIHAEIDATAELEKKKRNVLTKELVIRDRIADTKLQRIEQGDKDTAIAKDTNYSTMTEAEILRTQKDNSEYLEASKSAMVFINESFNEVVPFFRKNIILLGAKTGEGKSTAVANVIRTTIAHVHPETQKKRKILVITNEERREDVYNRVTCLVKGWHYVAHDKFSKEQIATFNQYIRGLSNMITVIDDNFNGASGTTTTLEGISQVFQDLMDRKEYYDAILIDYYQNIAESRDNPSMKDWEVQSQFVKRLDKFKNLYPAPIVVLAQLKPGDEENSTFKARIEGRKAILNVATCALEIAANKEEHTTEWTVQKSRFNEAMGDIVTTGYDKGQYVVCNDDFRSKVQETIAIRNQRRLDKQIGHMPTPKAEEEK